MAPPQWLGRNPRSWCLGAAKSSGPPSASPGAPPAPQGLTCVITLWLAFLRPPRPSLHNKRVRKKRESSPRAQPPAPNELYRAVPGRPRPSPRPYEAGPEVGPRSGVYSWALAPARRSLPGAGPFRPHTAPDFLQSRRTERSAGPSPRGRVVFMAPSADLC